MSASGSKKKRQAPSQTPASSANATVINSLLDSYNFLVPNEYSEKTIGLQSFLLRKSVGDINFSDIIDEGEKRHKEGQTTDFAQILDDKRQSLHEIEASIEKCLMLNRLIAYIKENESNFTKLISDIRLEMQVNMADTPNNPSAPDFRQREYDFNLRKHTQEVRRLFYHSNDELKNPKNLVYLQDRTTEQLLFIKNQMSRDSKSRQTYSKELENILQTSFMIVAQPHSGVNPVTIYERKGPGEYTAKISVIIISLLYDFMQYHPDVIELYDIEPSLYPLSQYYKLEEPRAISWKTCQVQTGAAGRTRTFLYAELTSITIQQTSKTDTRVRFAQLSHFFKFAIKLQINMADSSKPPTYQFPLESLPFGIGAHNNQIPQLLTRVLLDDIRRFSKIQPADVKTIHKYMQRYFIHRTGVKPNDSVTLYLEQELIRASGHRNSFQSLDDIYLDFLVNFVYQVEFMAKHPTLAMFHADGLFLGICSSERAAEAIVQSAVAGSPVICLRFNSIRIDYNAISAVSSQNRTVKLAPCAVRVDIYNDRTKKLQNRTFDSSTLANDISRFVASGDSENASFDSASRIRILSNFDERANNKTFISFKQFAKYYHKRLQEICKSDEKYKPVTDLVDNVTCGNTEEEVEDNLNKNTLDVLSPLNTNVSSVQSEVFSAFDNEHSLDMTNQSHEYMSMPYESSNHTIASPQSVLSSQDRSQQMPYANDPDAVMKYVLSQPNLVEQVVRQFHTGVFNVTPSAPPPPQQRQQQQSQIQYPVQSPPYHQQMPIHIMQQQQAAQLSFQQPSPRYQPAPSPTTTMQFQTTIPSPQQQQQTYFPQQILLQQQLQRTASPVILHYFPNNINQPTTPMSQQSPLVQMNGNANNTPQQLLDQTDLYNLLTENFNQTTINPVQQQNSLDQTSDEQFGLNEIEQYLNELTNAKPTEINN